MAGYMGFGMQSWLYNKRPRKPFAKRRQIPSFTPLHSFSRTFKIKPHVKKSKCKTVFFGLIISISMIFLIQVCTKKLTLYSNNYSKKMVMYAIQKDNNAFDFLLKSGKSRLSSNNVLGAYSEFNLAYNIKPDSKELNQLLIETLSILCFENNKYCIELDFQLEAKN